MMLFGISIPLINYIFCFIISVIGFIYYKKTKKPLLFFISFAFYFFGFSHFAQMSGLDQTFFSLLLILRIAAYNFMIIGLLKTLNIKYYATLTVSILFSILVFSLYYFKFLNNIPTLPLLNLVFCLIILGLSIFLYKKEKSTIALYLIVAYLFFTIAQIARLFSLEKTIAMGIILSITVGYFVIFLMFFVFLIRDLFNFIRKNLR